MEPRICENCGMPLDRLHTRMSCQVNRDQFDMDMGRYDIPKTEKEKSKDDADDKEDNSITNIVIAVVLIILTIGGCFIF